MDLVFQQRAFGCLRKAVIVVEVGEAAPLLRVLKEVWWIEGSNERVMGVRKAEEPPAPANAAVCGDMARSRSGHEAECLLHNLNAC